MTLPTPKRMRRSTSHRRAPAQEAASARRLGGHTTKGSGSGHEKGDVRVHGVVRVECKTTRHDSFRVTRAMVEKIEEAALGAGEVPVLEVELALGAKRVYVVPDWALEAILDAARKA